MMDELTLFDDWMGGLLSKLDAPARRTAMRDVAQALRRSQQARIAAQRNPDGSAYDARKPRLARATKALRDKRGRLKRSAMFVKLRTTQYMRSEVDATGLAIGFAGRVAGIARVHQFGETDRVASGGPTYTYPARVLLGFTNEDRERIGNILLQHLTQ